MTPEPIDFVSAFQQHAKITGRSEFISLVPNDSPTNACSDDCSLEKGRFPAKRRNHMNQFQVKVLMRVLDSTAFPSRAVREELARTLNVPAKSIQIWFQNQRQKAKSQLRGSKTTAREEICAKTPSPSPSSLSPQTIPIANWGPTKDYTRPNTNGMAANYLLQPSSIYLADSSPVYLNPPLLPSPVDQPLLSPLRRHSIDQASTVVQTAFMEASKESTTRKTRIMMPSFPNSPLSNEKSGQSSFTLNVPLLNMHYGGQSLFTYYPSSFGSNAFEGSW